jgi:arsenate reductase (thioredoxin)
MKKVLFVCIHNSARSQMAEELLRKYGGDIFETESAGLEPGTLNSTVVELLKKDENIDISSKKTQSVFDLFKNGKTYNYVITVCDAEASQKCPLFPGITNKINWSFDDPSQFTGSNEEKLNATREIKETIKKHILDFIDTYK